MENAEDITPRSREPSPTLANPEIVDVEFPSLSDHQEVQSNEQIIEQLTKRIDALRQIQSVFTENYPEYVENYKSLCAWLVDNGYTKDNLSDLDLLLDNFEFEDMRFTITSNIIAALQNYYPDKPEISACLEPENAPIFFTLFYFTMNAVQQHENVRLPVCSQMSRLLTLQCENLQSHICDLLPPPSPSPIKYTPTIAQPPSSNRAEDIPQASGVAAAITTQPPTPSVFFGLSANTWMILIGSSLVTTSVLLNLSPKFAMLLGVYLSPFMFVLLVVIGAAMTIYGASQRDPESLPPPNSQRPSCFSLEFWRSGCGFWPREPLELIDTPVQQLPVATEVLPTNGMNRT